MNFQWKLERRRLRVALSKDASDHEIWSSDQLGLAQSKCRFGGGVVVVMGGEPSFAETSPNGDPRRYRALGAAMEPLEPIRSRIGCFIQLLRRPGRAGLVAV